MKVRSPLGISKTMDVAVVGCGSPGAASALHRSRAGHRVTLFERVIEPGPLGAGIVLQPPALPSFERSGPTR